MKNESKMVKLIPCLYLYQGKAVTGFHDRTLFGDGDPVKLAGFYSEWDADSILVFDLSEDDAGHDEAISVLRKIVESSKCPVLAGGNVRRVEDVKKLLYAGCAKAVLNFSKETNVLMLEEVSKRFGRSKLLAAVANAPEYLENRRDIVRFTDGIVCMEVGEKENAFSQIARGGIPLARELSIVSEVPVILHTLTSDREELKTILHMGKLDGITGTILSSPENPVRAFRQECLSEGIHAYHLVSAVPWEEFKLGADGLIPVVVQDYRNEQVLMEAYMNKEAYEATLTTGKMTYYSRSRKELWLKGLTSGHYQYVKSLSIDCDKDTILAKVDQVGAACHTGSRSCFFTPLAGKDCDDANPLHVFQDVYQVILDRKAHPREGSYTNYLFDKGMDKILKKVGEECAEIIIAAKNPDKEEVTYEISDFLYHCMVMMAEKGITWDDVTRELANR